MFLRERTEREPAAPGRTGSRRAALGISLAAAVLALAWVQPATAQESELEPPEFGIGKTTNVPIEMDDGAVLRADVFYPTDSSGQAAPGPFPVIVSQTPYGKWISDQGLEGTDLRGGFLTGYEPYLVEHGYIAAVVDVRGTNASDGSFQFFGAREQADSVAVVDWASELPNSNGKVGMTGASYLGIIQLLAAGAVGPDSPLDAIFPIVAGNDPYREIATSGGMINLESDLALLGLYNGQLNAGLFAELLLGPAGITDPALGQRLLDHINGTGVDFSLGLTSDFLTDGDKAYDQDWWQERAPDRVLQRIADNAIPAYFAATLWDVFQEGALRNYAGLQNAWAGRPLRAPMSPEQPVTGRYQVLEKAEYHSTFFMGEPDLRPIQLAWFDHWLKGEDNGIDQTQTPLHLADQNGRRFEASHYPVAEAEPTPYYLAGGQRLSTAPPPLLGGADTLVWTGASLFCDRSLEQWSLGFFQLALGALGLDNPCAANDILPQSLGPGQLTYTTEPFASRTVLAGPIDLTLFATSTTPDSEWVAKLSDVAPDGTATDLTQGALLGSKRPLDESRTWRAPDGRPLMPWHPYTRAARQPVKPGAVTRYDIEVRPTFATLEPGHRLRLTILSSQTPHLLPFPKDVPNLLGGIYRVQRSPGAASFLELPLAPASAF